MLLLRDFNAEPESKELEAIRKDPEYVNLKEGIRTTFRGYYKGMPLGSIDYIFLKNRKEGKRKLVIRKIEKMEDKKEAVRLSEHYPISAELALMEE